MVTVIIENITETEIDVIRIALNEVLHMETCGISEAENTVPIAKIG